MCACLLSLSLSSLSLSAVEHLNVSTLQEIFNITAIHTLEHNAAIPPSQLRTIILEVYTTLRTLKPILGTSKLKQAQELCFNWLQMAYECADGGTIDCGSLKLILCMFVGGKPADKSRCKNVLLEILAFSCSPCVLLAPFMGLSPVVFPIPHSQTHIQLSVLYCAVLTCWEWQLQ